MKKQFAFLIPAFILVLFVVSSCGKEDDPIVVKTKTELLAQGSWKFKSASAGGTDVSNQTPFDACRKDNILTFTAAGAGTIDEGPSKCNVGDLQTTSITWNFAANETTLHVSNPLFANTGNDFTLVSISETELVVSIGYAPPVGPVILVTITFSH